MKTSLGFVLGCVSIGVYASLGACSASSSTNGSSVGGAPSGRSDSGGSSGTGSSGSGSGGGSSSGGSSGGGSSSGGSSGASSGASSGSSSGGGSTNYIGEIRAIMASAAGTSSWSGAAAFAATPDAGGGSTCNGTQSGNCCYTPPGTSPGNTLAYVSAGDIVVKDGSTTIATMSPTTQSGVMNVYAASNQQDATYQWTGGDTLSFAAAGATVNAFSGTVVAPGLMQNINPAFSISTSTMVSATSDFTVTWTPGATSGAASSIYVNALMGMTPDGAISCNGMDSAGSITVPQALLANLTSGDALQIVLTRLVTSVVTTGNVKVLIGVSAETLGAGQLQ